MAPRAPDRCRPEPQWGLETTVTLSFSHPRYGRPESAVENIYVTNGSAWDYTVRHRTVKVGDLPQIYQASGVFDQKTGRMVIIGNSSDRLDEQDRGLWVSDRVDPSKPNTWIPTLHRIGDVSLRGNRESQLVGLQGGGFLFIAATNCGPVSAIAAATPEGLMNAEQQVLITPSDLPSVYGPTVCGLSFDPLTRIETVNIRVSTWPNPRPYDPHTYRTSFTVEH